MLENYYLDILHNWARREKKHPGFAPCPSSSSLVPDRSRRHFRSESKGTRSENSTKSSRKSLLRPLRIIIIYFCFRRGFDKFATTASRRHIVFSDRWGTMNDLCVKSVLMLGILFRYLREAIINKSYSRRLIDRFSILLLFGRKL